MGIIFSSIRKQEYRTRRGGRKKYENKPRAGRKLFLCGMTWNKYRVTHNNGTRRLEKWESTRLRRKNVNLTAEILPELFKDVLKKGKIPDDWKKVCLPKSERKEISHCVQVREMILFSLWLMVFVRIIRNAINHIK